MKTIHFKKISTPIGDLVIASTDRGICWLGGIKRFEDSKIWIQKMTNPVIFKEDKNYSLIIRAENEISNYFNHKLDHFSIPLDLFGTDFQKKVWLSISTIPFGQTLTYSELAQAVNSPQAVRSIGTICGLNPIIILIPCHRVIGKNGKLTGFIEGIERKELLLNLEKTHFQTKLF